MDVIDPVAALYRMSRPFTLQRSAAELILRQLNDAAKLITLRFKQFTRGRLHLTNYRESRYPRTFRGRQYHKIYYDIETRGGQGAERASLATRIALRMSKALQFRDPNFEVALSNGKHYIDYTGPDYRGLYRGITTRALYRALRGFPFDEPTMAKWYNAWSWTHSERSTAMQGSDTESEPEPVYRSRSLR